MSIIGKIRLESFWTEISPDGETIVCFKTKRRGKEFTERGTFQEIADKWNKKLERTKQRRHASLR